MGLVDIYFTLYFNTLYFKGWESGINRQSIRLLVSDQIMQFWLCQIVIESGLQGFDEIEQV